MKHMEKVSWTANENINRYCHFKKKNCIILSKLLNFKNKKLFNKILKCIFSYSLAFPPLLPNMYKNVKYNFGGKWEIPEIMSNN